MFQAFCVCLSFFVAYSGYYYWLGQKNEAIWGKKMLLLMFPSCDSFIKGLDANEMIMKVVGAAVLLLNRSPRRCVFKGLLAAAERKGSGELSG